MRGAFALNTVFAAIFAALTLGASDAVAQNRFSPIIRVGDEVITQYQLDQRTLFLTLLRAPGDPRQLAREQLINEAVQMNAVADAGMTPPPEDVEAGLTEFAARANLTSEQFVAALGQGGVGPETFRDFVAVGVAWRNLMRERFGEQAQDISRTQINRTISQTGTEGGTRVLVSEILLPAGSPETAAASRARATQITSVTGEDAFAAAARRYSVAPTAQRGGAQNWLALDSLPDDVARVVSSLAPGQISRPVELDGVIAIYLLRDTETVPAGAPGTLSVDYALFITDGGRSAAEALTRKIDVCDDLYGIAKGLPAERLVRETLPISSLPADIRAEVEAMDAGETSTAITRGGNATVLMLCDRKPAQKSTVDIDIIGNRLLNARLGALASDYLADLRDATFIEDLTR